MATEYVAEANGMHHQQHHHQGNEGFSSATKKNTTISGNSRYSETKIKHGIIYQSFTYEVTFGVGTIGINLQNTRSGKGVYVDTFYRPYEGAILPAEQCGYIKLGDMVLEINGEDVTELNLDTIPRIIEKAKRPMTVKFERLTTELSLLEVVCDPRKMPWFMHYLVEKYGIEDSIYEQAKLMLWLECEQYVVNVQTIPDGDFSDQANNILKKFFRPDSNFSLLLHVPEKVRSSMLIALASAETSTRRKESDGPLFSNNVANSPATRSITPTHQLSCNIFLEAQAWAEQDMKHGSFKSYCSSSTAARMISHLLHSPPFVKLTLANILSCDRKTMFLYVFLSQIKRHNILMCCLLLKNKPDEQYEGSMKVIEELLRCAVACVQVLTLQEGRVSAEDLPMITKLSNILPASTELSDILCSSSKVINRYTSKNFNSVSYVDNLQKAVSLSIPITESLYLAYKESGIIAEIRKCLYELRLAVMRELASEILPKFLSSKECEYLLWEINSHTEFIIENRRSESVISDDSIFEEDMDVAPNNFVTPTKNSNSAHKTKLDEISAPVVVPDGAIQRLLRKVNLPNKMTMHRAPMDLLIELNNERNKLIQEPMAWFLSFSAKGGRISYEVDASNVDTIDNSTKRLHSAKAAAALVSTDNEDIVVESMVSIPYDSKEVCVPIDTDKSLVPDSITGFLMPNGTCVYDSVIPSSKLINFTIKGKDNCLLYASALILHRHLLSRVPSVKRLIANSKKNTVKKITRFEQSTFQKPETNNLPPKTPKSNLKSFAVEASEKSYGDWLGQMSSGLELSIKKNTTPLIEKFKAISLVTIQTPQQQQQHRRSPLTVQDASSINLGNELNATPIDPAHAGAQQNGISNDNVTPQNIVHSHQPVVATPSVNNNSVSTNPFNSMIESEIDNGGEDEVVNLEYNTVHLYASYGFCLLSKAPTINTLRNPLTRLYSDEEILKATSYDLANGSTKDDLETLPFQHDGKIRLDKAVSNIATEDSLASLRKSYSKYKSNLNMPELMRPGGTVDFDIEMVLRSLNPRNFVTMFIAFILELKIVMISSKVTLLTAVGELFKTLIAPLCWSHIYVPLIPKKLSNEILHCPTPFFVGMHRDCLDPSQLPHDICLCDLDNDICKIPHDLSRSVLAGRRLARSIDRVLRPALYHCDEPLINPNEYENEHFERNSLFNEQFMITPTAGVSLSCEVIRLCKQFLGDLLIGVEQCCVYAVDHDELVVFFDEAMFQTYKQSRAKESMFPPETGFMEQFLRTQAFSLCVAGNILKKLNPNNRPASRPTSPFVTIPPPSPSFDGTPPGMPLTPVHTS